MNDFIPTDEQWSKMQKHIKSSRYKKEDFFVFETLAVGDRIVPDRFIRITPALLEIMKQDAQQGISLMLNHNWNQEGVQSIPIGKVFDARLGGPTQDGETTTLYTTQYILRDDSKVDGYSKNDIINLIESGILADTSIGWGTTRESYKCSICGNCIYDWRKCEHIPGRKYIVNEETNEVKTCIVEAHAPTQLHAGNNVLMENSIVFDGAYPNAIIQSSIGNNNAKNNGLKVLEKESNEALSDKDIIIGYSKNGNVVLLYQSMNEEGGINKMENENNAELENTENVVETSTEGTENTENAENVEETTESTQSTESTEESVESTEESTETTESTEESTGEATGEALFTEKDILDKFDNISANIEGLIQLAKEGLNNRNEVIAKALESGVHSMGNAFKKDIFERTFSNMATKDIKEMGETWEQEAKAKFGNPKVSKQKTSSTNEQMYKMKYDMNQFKTN